MRNYYIDESGQQFEIFDQIRIDLHDKNIVKLIIEDSFVIYKNLYLNNNKLTSIKLNLPNCERLDLDNNQLTNVNLNIPNCKILDLYNNKLTSVELNLPNCELLSLYNNKLTSVKLNIPNCKILYLNKNQLTSVNLNIPNCDFLYTDPETKLIQDNGDIIIGIDGTPIIVKSEKTINEFKVLMGESKNGKTLFVVSKNNISAHGKSIPKAINDWTFKYNRTEEGQ